MEIYNSYTNNNIGIGYIYTMDTINKINLCCHGDQY